LEGSAISRDMTSNGSLDSERLSCNEIHEAIIGYQSTAFQVLLSLYSRLILLQYLEILI
jgi:hypothetical protein